VSNPESVQRHLLQRATKCARWDNGMSRGMLSLSLTRCGPISSMATGLAIYGSGHMTPKLIELLSIAFGASYTHMYAPGTRRHIKAALKLGATMEEIMDVLKLCVVQGIQACSMGVPILQRRSPTFQQPYEARVPVMNRSFRERLSTVPRPSARSIRLDARDGADGCLLHRVSSGNDALNYMR
jgi:alkylhydroperoxidase/carboxymuconolactone decarboxylase family protein YurZ